MVAADANGDQRRPVGRFAARGAVAALLRRIAEPTPGRVDRLPPGALPLCFFFLKIFLPFRHFDHHFTVFLFTKLFPFEFDSEFRAALLPSVDRLFIWFYWLLLSCSSLYWVCAHVAVCSLLDRNSKVLTEELRKCHAAFDVYVYCWCLLENCRSYCYSIFMGNYSIIYPNTSVKKVSY